MHNIPRMASYPLNRIGVIDVLEKRHKLIHAVTESLCHYMEYARRYREGNKKLGISI